MNFNFKECVESKMFKGIIIGICSVLALAIVFQAGQFVGLKKAEYSGHLGDNYSRIFDQPGERGLPMMGPLPFENLPGSHGAVGQVINVSTSTATSTIVVAELNNVEKIVLIDNKTIIRQFRDQISAGNLSLKIGDFVSVLGEANDKGEIEAKFIRIMPK